MLASVWPVPGLVLFVRHSPYLSPLANPPDLYFIAIHLIDAPAQLSVVKMLLVAAIDHALAAQRPDSHLSLHATSPLVRHVPLPNCQ